MIAVRQTHKAFGNGNMTFLRPRNRKVLAYLREHEGDVMLCVFNLSRSAQAVELDLSGQKGKVPVELTGASPFPPIGTLPYLLTLPAYGFYWFTLADASRLPTLPEHEPESLPELETLILGEGWNIVESQRGDRERIDRFVYDLSAHLYRASALVRAEGRHHRVRHTRAHRRTAAGRPRELPASRHQCRPQGRRDPALLPAPCTVLGRGGFAARQPASALSARQDQARATGGHRLRRRPWRDLPPSAAQGDDASTTPCRRSTARFASMRAMRSGRWTSPKSCSVRRVGTGEHAHTTRTLGDEVSLKISRRLRPGMDPGIEMGRFLAKAGFANSPPYLGAIEYVDDAGVPTALAVAFEHVRNQGDGWTVVVNALDRELEEASLSGLGSGESEGLPYSLSLVETIGRRTGELHRTLAGADGSDPNFAPGSRHVGGSRRMVRTRTRPCRAGFRLSGTPARDGRRGNARPRRQAARLARSDAQTHRHAGSSRSPAATSFACTTTITSPRSSFPRTTFTLSISKGEPDQPVDERRQKAPPSRDIATMLRSFDYAARTAVDRQRQRGASQLDEIEARAMTLALPRRAAIPAGLRQGPRRFSERVASRRRRAAALVPGRQAVPRDRVRRGEPAGIAADSLARCP